MTDVWWGSGRGFEKLCMCMCGIMYGVQLSDVH